MNWQVKYALENFAKSEFSIAQHIRGDLLKVVTQNQPDVSAAISAAYTIDLVTAIKYKEEYPELEFLCGYRPVCIWTGDAIDCLESTPIGWGNFNTLSSAAFDGDATNASQKLYKFADRLLRQYGRISQVSREFDRIHRIVLRNGVSLRIGMIAEYEPTADAVRSLWEKFGAIDVAWNINPNGFPTDEAVSAGRELGCIVVKWEELKCRIVEA